MRFAVALAFICLINPILMLDTRRECDYSRVEIVEECPKLSVVDWEEFGEELYKARAMVFRNESSLGKKRLRDLIKIVTVTYGFHIGFECPLAVTSLMYSMALHMVNEKKFRLAQALIFMGFVFVRDKGFYDCAPWPVMGWDMLLAGRFLNDTIELHDRVIHRQKDFMRIPQEKVAIVSICAYSENAPIKEVSRNNHEMYANHHGYSLYQFENENQIIGNSKARMFTHDRNPFFWKVLAVQNVLDTGSYDWIMWMDCDAFFMDLKRTIDSVIDMYARLPTETCPPETPHLNAPTSVDLLITVDSTGINNGVWLIRKSHWAHNFLSQWWQSDILQGMGTKHNCSDQSTMQYELLYENIVNAIDNDIIDDKIQPADISIWPESVRIVPQEHMQSFHRATADAVVSREWRQGDFIKHHPGCHHYKKPCQDMYISAHEHFLVSFND